ncbi:putative nucleotidyltransferase/HEPN domain-containing protein [Novosphingobium chloroacetimidivorans]|uniref:Putative nucleotidyltransferase/HEPN domain-containing protein n=1 Tax=Novosphingobium chloroacetimidivorans TaxID=1428314 RepID=A0A7W7K9N8_9SPHN|nr:HEPN domain-containing protein [Novosphingobium chloroacetimidivorans]MBB4858776.1 putative nucleotidyltransferase/HEPN domain-containing protein [Novosphingobium chloroacetimidivorans]
MKTSLDHLPAAKQRELERVVQIVFEEFGAAHENATSRRKRGRILKVILYGSHARGGWVDEPHTAKGYVSDFDLLIIVNQKELTDKAAYWTAAEQRLIEEKLAGRLRTPTNFVVHTWQEVGDGMAHGRFFFMDIAHDGIALFEGDDRPLPEAKPKTPAQALAMAEEYFDEWFPAAMRKFKLSQDAIEQGFTKEAAFLLHQTAETLLHCVLLVNTFYTPHNHNLSFLRTQAERLDLRLVYVWPRDTRNERAMFEKLKDAYVKARYSKHYSISTEELTWLTAQVERLGQVVQEVCQDRLALLASNVREAG